MINKKKFVAILGTVAVISGLGGCSTGPSLSSLNPTQWFSGGDKPEITGTVTPAKQLYSSADQFLSAGKYEDAAKKFEEVDRQHPYSPLARRSIVMSAYSYYKNSNYPEAIAAAKRYNSLHPGTKETVLAQHVLAMSHYDQINDPSRDQRATRNALNELEKLVRDHPTSRYAPEARNKIRVARNVLAASEMRVGRFYLKKNNHLAAINRFKAVVANYSTTPQVEEALMRLTESYMALGVKSEAQSAAAILGHNFPNSHWYRDAYQLLKTDGIGPREDTGGWLSKSWKKAVNTAKSLSL